MNIFKRGQSQFDDDNFEVNISSELDDYVEIEDNEPISLNDFIYDEWCKKFPDKTNLDIDLIKRLASQSRGLKQWYLEVNAKYKSGIQIPDNLKDLVTIEEYNEVRLKVAEIKNELKEKQRELDEIAKLYRSEQRKIDEKYKKLEHMRLTDALLYCLTITAEDLPLSTRLMLENYTPQKGDMTRKQKGKQELIEYKRVLIKLYKNGGDVKTYVDENLTKF